MEQIYLHSLPVKEYQIVDFFLPKLKDEVMKVRTDRPITELSTRKIYDRAREIGLNAPVEFLRGSELQT